MRTRVENPIARQKLLEAAEELMLQKGFTATSLDELCRKAKLTKGSFFHYFKNKEELGKAVLDQFYCSSRDKVLDGCSCYENSDPLKRIDGYLDYIAKVIKEQNGKGCLLASFSTELAEISPSIRVMCEERFDEWANAFKKDLKEAKKKYAPKANINIDSLAEHFLAIVEGSQVLAKAKRDRNIMVRNLDHYKKYLHAVFGK